MNSKHLSLLLPVILCVSLCSATEAKTKRKIINTKLTQSLEFDRFMIDTVYARACEKGTTIQDLFNIQHSVYRTPTVYRAHVKDYKHSYMKTHVPGLHNNNGTFSSIGLSCPVKYAPDAGLKQIACKLANTIKSSHDSRRMKIGNYTHCSVFLNAENIPYLECVTDLPGVVLPQIKSIQA